MDDAPSDDRAPEPDDSLTPLPTLPSPDDPKAPWLTMELQFLSQLNLIADADLRIKELDLGIGRVHHRILYFVDAMPGVPVGHLLRLIRVTNQNVHRPMGDLVRMGLIEQRTSEVDRRQRNLYTTARGSELLKQLTSHQFARVRRAFDLAGPESVKGYWTVLWHMIEEHERQWVLGHEQEALGRPAGTGSVRPRTDPT
ncbi:MarR family winged helix-turn-helix transcriptional regulator [Chachezhania sediminis]|uniref:MarR family winged helix-turn-helix transcriptional regulator n=1 Tax=Chachezhania sediminis TaxID=2599291 RepID=UPI00131E7AC2|nr:MarR family winged helix-turn-helix transcriptional regulator [Chachezhania sediminis]